jgi:glyoxylase-like metal-dependent hydrolase (beta-lactamase superfamily II)
MHLRTRLLYLLCAWPLGSGAAPTADAPPSLTRPNVQQVSPHVYALVGDMDVPNERNQGFICNSVFVITDKSVVVVDPGGSVQVGRMLLAEIRRVTPLPVSHVIDTHHHADHWMGNHAFAELTPRPAIVGHRIMRDSAADIADRWLAILRDMTHGATRGTRAVLPDTLVSGDEVLHVGGMDLVLFHPPHAHTRGDIAVYLPQERTLIAGDILFYRRTPGFQDASPKGNAAALEDFLKLDVEHVVPGHGPVTDRSGIVYMRDYLRLLRAQVEKYYQQGLSDYEMQDRIDVGDYRSMSGFRERFGVNVNRTYAEVEAESF